MGDARLNYQEIMYGFFDLTLKGTPSAVMESQPKVRYYTMGNNKWNSSDVWPPKGATPVTYYLASGWRGQHPERRRHPHIDKPATARRRTSSPTTRWTRCPRSAATVSAAIPRAAAVFDQRKIEERKDVLVYTSEPFTEAPRWPGRSRRRFTSRRTSRTRTSPSRSSTSIRTAGRSTSTSRSSACAIATATTSRRCGWSGTRSTRSTLQPLVTSNYFLPGHRLRVEVSSSSFPRFERNLNTGGRNYDESKGVAAHTALHHSAEHPSSVTITVVKK